MHYICWCDSVLSSEIYYTCTEDAAVLTVNLLLLNVRGVPAENQVPIRQKPKTKVNSTIRCFALSENTWNIGTAHTDYTGGWMCGVFRFHCCCCCCFILFCFEYLVWFTLNCHRNSLSLDPWLRFPPHSFSSLQIWHFSATNIFKLSRWLCRNYTRVHRGHLHPLRSPIWPSAWTSACLASPPVSKCRVSAKWLTSCWPEEATGNPSEVSLLLTVMIFLTQTSPGQTSYFWG